MSSELLNSLVKKSNILQKFVLEPLNLIPEINVINVENKINALVENIYRLNSSGKILTYCISDIENIILKLKKHNLNVKSIKQDKLTGYFGLRGEIEIKGENVDGYFLLHYNLPPDLRLYFKDITNRKYSCATLFFNPDDKYIYEDFIKDLKKTDKHEAFRLFEKIEQAEHFAVTHRCRIFYLFSSLFYYTGRSECGICDNCKLKKLKKINIDTAIVEKILLAIKESREKFGITTISDILKGYKTQTVKKYNLSRLSGFGYLKEITYKRIKDYVKLLLKEDILLKSRSNYGALILNSTAEKFLDGYIDLKIINLPKHIDEEKEINYGIYCELRMLRNKIARMQSIPAFSIFKDEVLQEMSIKLPESHNDLLRLNGIGKIKVERFGDIFIDKIKELKSNQDQCHNNKI